MSFRLRFPRREIEHWASRYRIDDRERQIEADIAPNVKKNGVFTRDQFLTICRWKTARTQRQCRENDEAFIRALTNAALTAQHERIRIEALTLLRGVNWPTASVLLHFGHADPYPILDFRALRSVGVDAPPNYEFEFWWRYVAFCRRVASDAGVSMRKLDRALWQRSWEQSKDKANVQAKSRR